jgi:methionine-rich copper-binding protein CopC
MNSTFVDRYTTSKTFIACLIITLMMLGPLAPLSQASRSSSSRARTASTNAAPAPVPATPAPVAAPVAAPVVPIITATKTDSFPDPNNDGKAAPGETITYDVNVTNNGTDANDVTFTDTIDSNTTLVPGSLKVSPLAYADIFSAAQNTPLSVGAPGVLTNDTGIPTPTAVAIAGGATAQGGTITLNTNGSFLYTPAAGFTGVDTFNYTVTNGLTPNDTAQVTINVDAPPSVTATTPTNGAANQANNTDVTITFSEPVNVTGNWFQIVCTSSGTRNVADTVVTGGPTTFTINPNTDFSQNETCTVTVFAAQVSDQDANDPPDNMTADFVFSFTTTDAAPSVSTTNPTNGAANQNTNVNIDITFSEPVNVTGNWFQIVCTSSGTRNVSDTVVTGGPSAFTINPNADFAAAETCTVTVFAAQVTDQDSDDPPDNMAANFVFSFSTEAAPTVNATTPTNGATQIANNTNITLTFSEPVNVTGNWFQIVGSTSGTRNVADTVVTGGPTTFTINPNTDFANGESITVTVFAAQVTDQDANDPPDNMASDFAFSFTIDQPPSVTATTPTNGATNQSASTDLTITFSEPVNVTGNWFQIVCTTSGTRNVADTVVTGGPTTFTINPNTDFTAGESCTVTVFAAQVSDQDSGDPPDNMDANFVFSFQTTDAAPTVTATTPTNGATNLATNTNIDVTFSEPVNVTGNWFQIVCTTSGTRNVADTVVIGGPTTFTINPNTDFTQGESCTVTIFAAQVTDQDSNDPPDNMAANFVFSFNMDAAPSVTATTPTNGATQQASNTNVTVTFSEPVNVTANWFQLVGATSGTKNVADTVVTGGPTTFTINPNTDFAPGELVTVTVFAAQVSDQDSADPPDNMTVNFVFSFTIDQAPSVTATTPTNGAINVALNSNLSITFSEPVNVTGNWFQIVCPTTGTRNVADTVVTGGPTTFTINPNADFTFNETCAVTVFAGQVSDQDSVDPPDNLVANFVFSFTTVDAAPTVSATNPTNGAVNQAANTNIDVTFSEPVNVTGNWFQIVCTSSGTRNVVDTVVTGGPTSFTINPNTDFTQNETCTVTIIATQVTDQDTNDPPDAMAANFVFSFSIDAAPSVTATVPTNGATQIANNTNISITFSEPVNVTGNWFQIVGATSGTRNVVDTVVTGGPTTFSINPNTDFANGESVTVTVFAAQVTDQDGNDPPDNMLANFVFSFTIDQAPSVTSTVPTNGAINVLKTANIVINFSENVTATTSSFTIECPAPGNLQAFTVSGSGTNQITLDPTSNLPQGQICTVTVIANQISDTDTGDPPDNMVANFVFSFGVQPEAFDDARNATGNIQIQTAGRSNFSVLTNDIGPGITVTASDTTSARGGNVAVAANGTFTYNPPAGYEGPDSFNYTISNNAGSDVGTVNITITGMIWFIDDNAASGSCTTNNNICGRLTHPFSTLPSFEAVNGNATPLNGTDVIAPEAGDHIFFFSGTYTGPLTLENNQRVIGQGATTGTLSALSGITPATDSDTLPSTSGAKPSIGGGGFNVVSNNQIYGLQFDDSTTTSINSTANIGTMIIGDVTILNDASNGAGIILDDGGTSVTNVGTNTINCRSGVALNITNTTIGAGSLTFVSISAGNNDANADPASGIILNNTGSGRLIVTGNGNTSVGGNSSGGTIQNTTSHAISLTSTQDPSFTNINIQGAARSGVDGQQVTNFTLANSTINNVGTAAAGPFDESNISFNDNGAFTANTVSGTVSITQNTLTNARRHGIDIETGSGTISNLTITNNTLTSSTNSAVSLGTGILIAVQGSGGTTAHLTTGNINNNTITNFPSAEGIALLGGSGNVGNNTSSTLGANGTPVNITNNTIAGQATSTQHLGSNAIRASMNSQVGVMNVNISCNGKTTGGCTATGPITNIQGQGISVFAGGTITGTATITNNVIIANQTLGAGTQGLALQVDDGPAGLGTSAADYNATITNNAVSNYEGNGIRVIARASLAKLDVTVNNNNVGIPILGNRNAIRVDSGSAVGDTAICMAMSGNTGDGSGVNAGIGLRKQGTVATTNDFGIVGLSPSPATAAQAQAKVQTDNPASVGGVDILSGDNFVSCAQTASNRRVPNTNAVETSFTAMHKHDSQPVSETVAKPQQTAGKRLEGASPDGFRSLAKTKRESSVGTVASYSRSDAWVKSPIVNAHAQQQQGKKPPRGISIKPRVAPLAGETVNHSIGTLPGGKTVHITFQVTVNSPYLGGATVSNQGTVSSPDFANVLTDDPAVGGANDPTETPVLQTPNVSVADAQANEPASGTAQMLFTVTLSSPAPPEGASVHYSTADQPAGPGHAVAGVDYVAIPETPLNFAGGEQVKVVAVTILADADAPEPDETFLFNLTNAANAIIVDAQAVGTIKQGNAAGTFLITEFRTSGPAGDGDDFVEVYNNSDSPLTIAASDGSAGYGLFKKGVNCSATPVLIGVIPNGTVIPARGHYLFVGSAYSLSNYGGTGAAAGDLTMTEDIDPDTNIAIFNTSSVANLSSITRLDAVGLSGQLGANCLLLSEGGTVTPPVASVLEYSFHRDQCGKKGNPAIFGPCPTAGGPADTNDNQTDFIYSDTSGTATPQGQRLGAPGPENLGSPRLRNSLTTLLLDSNIGAPAAPNRVRDLTPLPSNGANGTMSVRRRFVNNTGAPVTRLRFRIVDISSISVPGGIADVRALTSTSVVVTGITDAGTCLASTGSATTPCTVTVLGTTLETPPAQALGGALNSSMSAGTITLAAPLAPGASINLQFLLGVQQTGSFKFFFNIEALP